MADPVRFVLCRPQDPRNVAECSKALLYAGFGDIVVTYPADPVMLSIARFGNLRLCESLDVALKGASLVAGFTRRHGQFRKSIVYELEDLASRIAALHRPGTPPVALLFGNETSGLSAEELLTCHVVATIPTNDACPSLNLSHAVALVAYRLRRSITSGAVRQDPGLEEVVDTEVIDRLVLHLDGVLHAVGFRARSEPKGTLTFLRDLCARALLSTAEAALLESLFEELRHGLAGPDQRGRRD